MIFLFLTGFSNPIMSDNMNCFGVLTTNMYIIYLITPIGLSDWITVNFVIMTSPIIPQCSNSQTITNAYQTASWNITTNSQYTYVFGIETIDK
jgi:hypothetical protein